MLPGVGCTEQEFASSSISVASDGAATRPTADHSDEIMFSSTAGRLLAVTYTWRWSTGEYESDILFGTNVPWFQASGEGDGCYEGVARYDFQNVATHEVGHVYGLGHVTSPFNTMGTPVVCLPCGFHSTGKPIGLQLSGRHWQDDVVLRAAHALEQAVGIGYRVPPVTQAALATSPARP